MEQNQGSFFDKKTIFAVVLTAVVFMGWQKYLAVKYPNYATKNANEAEKSEKKDAPAQSLGIGEQVAIPKAGVAEGKEIPNLSSEKFINVDFGTYSAQVSSYGLGVKNLVLKKYSDRSRENVRLGNSALFGLFELRLKNQLVVFDISDRFENNEHIVIGTAQVGQMLIKRTLVFHDNYSLTSKIEIQNPDQSLSQFEIKMSEVKVVDAGGSIFAPATDFQEAVILNDKNTERINLTTTKDNLVKSLGLQNIFGISSHYFATAYANISDILPEVEISSKVDDREASLSGIFKLNSLKASMIFEAVGFFGPKDFNAIGVVAKASNADFSRFIDFGFFSSIGKILLKVMQFFYYNTVANWGMAIIFLTLLVRLIVMPFNIFSFKSMKKMQVIQPRIAALREAYRDDPTTLNTEMMKLMKDQKVNPLGGCLPMLLQMPVFFALYQVLGQSIELYQAPFYGWIQDLSLKDPLYVTPVLMGVAMWYNQKITPNTMDPAQARIMQFLPLVFSFMMIALPSGLTLYIFVSTLFGIVQQQIFMKDRSVKTV